MMDYAGALGEETVVVDRADDTQMIGKRSGGLWRDAVLAHDRPSAK
jgi:hypothetical protein